jgi:glycosyltransferase involved in cell wall biosynthesis
VSGGTPAPRVVMLGEAWFADRAGGLNRYFAELLAALNTAGARPDALLLGPADGAPSGVVVAGDVRARLARRLVAFRNAAAGLSTNSDVVDAHFALYAWLPLLTTEFRRRPLIVHFQGPWADESSVSGGRRWTIPVKRRIERMVYTRADRVIVLSRAFGDLVVERYGVDPARVVVIPPGVDVDRFVPGDRAKARAAFALSPSAFVAVAVRRLDARMGLDTLVASWSEVQAQRPDAVLLMAGEGPERDRLETLRLGLPRPEGVRLLGRVSDTELIRLYQAADCSIVPTRALEGFGLVVLESLACGTPVITSDAGGLPEALDELGDTLVVPGDDHLALADRVLEAAAGALPSRAACRGHASRFRWDDAARRHLELYAEVLPRVRRPFVVFVDHCAQLSGAELALVRLLRVLDVRAHVILAEDGPLVGRLRDLGASVEVLPMAEAARGLRRERVRPGSLPAASAAAGAMYATRLARRLHQLQPDLVHTNSLKAALYGGLAGRLARVPVVWHVRDRVATDYLPPAAVRLVRAARMILPSAVIANSEATLMTLGGLPGAVVPSPIDRFPVAGTRCAEQPNAVLRVGVVGRLAAWKGQHVFLDAFARAFPDGDERAVIAGGALFGAEDAVYGEGLRDQAEALGIRDRVELLGHVDEVAAVYGDLDVLVHSSTVPEPFGQVVLEGMAAGLAVVAANAGGPAEIVTDGVDALLYPPGDAGALAVHLRRLRTDSSFRAQLGEAARRRAADFAPERAAAQVTDVYRRVLGARGLPPPSR